MFSFLLMLALESVFIWLLLRRKKVEKEIGDTNRLNEQAIKELYTTPAQRLAEPMSSVTEQTTNRLEPIYTNRKSK